MEAAPWLLEHFILNEIIEIFPFHRPSVLESYLQLIARFGLLRMMLAGVCNQPGAVPEPALLVKTTGGGLIIGVGCGLAVNPKAQIV